MMQTLQDGYLVTRNRLSVFPSLWIFGQLFIIYFVHLIWSCGFVLLTKPILLMAISGKEQTGIHAYLVSSM